MMPADLRLQCLLEPVRAAVTDRAPHCPKCNPDSVSILRCCHEYLNILRNSGEIYYFFEVLEYVLGQTIGDTVS